MQLIETMDELKEEWRSYQRIEELSRDPFDAFIESRLAEAKYFYLFKEAKIRNVKVPLDR